MKLNEIFKPSDTGVPFEKESDSTDDWVSYIFTIDGTDPDTGEAIEILYEVVFHYEAPRKVNKISPSRKSLMNKALANGFWDLGFSANYEGMHGETNLTGTGKSKIVFSTVTKIIEAFAKEYGPTYLFFRVSDIEPSRKTMYSRWVKHAPVFTDYQIGASNDTFFVRIGNET